ncbi:MAG: MotA/TolQ/ExbB proton channel family protein [Planctomycetota bacterium]
MVLIATLACLPGRPSPAQGQTPTDASQIDPAAIQSIMNAGEDAEQAIPPDEPSGIDMLSLVMSGGRFMMPIGLMSVLVVTLAVERSLSLRRGKILPRPLVRELRRLAEPIEHFDPEEAYRACLQNPSPASSVVAAMILRTGQPLGDVERVATETIGREADRYAAPVRWLSLAAAATPLMGLLGTVWGMIVAFHESTTLAAGRSRSEQLSEGIYTALVTTLAGLAVAIPAAIFAQFLENRISKLFHQMEQLAFDLAPGLTRFAGQRRMRSDGVLTKIDPRETRLLSDDDTPVPPPPDRVAPKGPPKGKASKGNAAKVS